MSFFVSKSINVADGVRVGYIKRIRGRTGGVLGFVLLLIGLAFYGVVFHLMANLLTTPARGESVCEAAQHFISTNAEDMRQRAAILQQCQMNPNRKRDDRKKDQNR